MTNITDMKNGRINERNTGEWSVGSNPKKRSTKPKKVSRSFTPDEVEMFEYIMNKVVDNVELDASDKSNQVYRDNGNILIQFDRERMEDLRSLLAKFNKQ